MESLSLVNDGAHDSLESLAFFFHDFHFFFTYVLTLKNIYL